MNKDFMAGPDVEYYWPRSESRKPERHKHIKVMRDDKRSPSEEPKPKAKRGPDLSGDDWSERLKEYEQAEVAALNPYSRVFAQVEAGTGKLPKKRKAKTANAKVKIQLARRDGLYCYLCGREFPFEDLRMEHKIPRSRGGKNLQSNLGLACAECDIAKGDMTPQEYWAKLGVSPPNTERCAGNTIGKYWPASDS